MKGIFCFFKGERRKKLLLLGDAYFLPMKGPNTFKIKDFADHDKLCLEVRLNLMLGIN